MDNYNFDEIIDRRNTNSYKWDSASDGDVLPMWVADMDFKAAPPIIDALQRRVAHGVFGYTRVPECYYSAITGWFSRRHSWSIDPGSIIYTSGVVPALSAVIKALAAPGSKVIIQTPVYNCFFSSIRNNGCEILDCPLVFSDNTYTIDFEALERCAEDRSTQLMLLCNPHNPAGRAWTREELERIGEICMRHGVTIVSDEIHCELVMPGHKYTPFATVSKELAGRSVVCCSPSKAFNIAGLQIANIIVPDPDMRAAIDRAININEVCDVNPFGVEALIAAYNHGDAWIDSLNRYLYGNYTTLCDFFARHMPQLGVTRLEATYLVWVDCRSLGIGSKELEERLVKTEKLWLNSGTMYGTDGFMRINIACPRSVMLDGLGRLLQFVNSL